MAKFKWYKHRFTNEGTTILHWGRRTGKTTKILEYLYDNKDAICIMPNYQMARLLRREADNFSSAAHPGLPFKKKSSIQPNRILFPSDSLMELLRGRNDSSTAKSKKICIDEACMLQEEILRVLYDRYKVELITTTRLNQTLNDIVSRNRKGYDHKGTKIGTIYDFDNDRHEPYSLSYNGEWRQRASSTTFVISHDTNLRGWSADNIIIDEMVDISSSMWDNLLTTNNTNGRI